MEKHSLPVLVAVLMAFPLPAGAQHQRTFETCRSYRHTETYVPGRINANGRYEQGEVRTKRRRIDCAPDGYTTAHGGHHYGHPPAGYPYPVPVPYPQHQGGGGGQPVVVNNSSAPECGGKLVRMGLGGILGGVAGRYAVGGRKSNKTILGTTIGAVAGSLVGRATC